jgi:hypothetical protein
MCMIHDPTIGAQPKTSICIHTQRPLTDFRTSPFERPRSRPSAMPCDTRSSRFSRERPVCAVPATPTVVLVYAFPPLTTFRPEPSKQKRPFRKPSRRLPVQVPNARNRCQSVYGAIGSVQYRETQIGIHNRRPRHRPNIPPCRIAYYPKREASWLSSAKLK